MHGNSLFNNIPSAPALEAEHLTNKVTDEGRLFSDLTQAILANKVARVKALVAELNAMQDYVLINKLQDVGELNSISLLSLAVLESIEEVVAELLEHKEINVNVVNDKKENAFMLAVLKGNNGMMLLLLEHGANRDAVNVKGSNVLMIAAQQGHLSIVNLLLEKGLDINAKANNGATAFTLAAERGHAEVVRSLLKYGADINAKNASGCTGFIYAAQNNHLEVLRLVLADDKLEINAVSMSGQTAIMSAALAGSTASVELILNSGRKIDFSFKCEGYDALGLAQLENHTDVVNLLKDYIKPLSTPQKSTKKLQESKMQCCLQ